VRAHLALTLDQPAYHAGATVTGAVEIAQACDVRQLTVALEYRDWTADYHAVGRTVALEVPLAAGSLQAGMRFPFTVTLPVDALPGQSGDFGSTSWGVHARADRRGIDYHAWQPFALAGYG
jgi:hypothetical protein